MINVFRLLITYVDDENEETWKGYLYAILILVSALSQTLILNRYYFCMWKVYMNVQSSLNPIIYTKVLKLSNGARKGILFLYFVIIMRFVVGFFIMRRVKKEKVL